MDDNLRSAIKRAGDWQTLHELIRHLDATTLQARDVTVIQRALAKCEGKADLQIAYLGDHTLDVLPKYLEVISAIQGIRVKSYVGPYGQYFQEVLHPDSPMHAFAPDLILLSLTPRKLSPAIASHFLELSTTEKIQEKQRVFAHIEEWIDAARSLTGANLMVANFTRPAYTQAGIADAKLEYPEARWYAEFNQELLSAYRDDPRVNIVDLNYAASCYGLERVYDPKMYYLARMEWSEGFMPFLAQHLFRYIVAIKGITKKCLVVDLDNTIWGGVVGEDGVTGIQVDKGHTQGEIFYDFQNVIRGLKARGILLAICSKNNPSDVQEVFEKRSEMPLRLDDFAAKRINWEHKNENLQEIASLLNIGTDSLVFIDDNPVERELVKNTLQEVSVIDLPQDPVRYASVLQTVPLFEKISITSEDTGKSEQYRQNAERQESQQKSGDIKSFLESLQTELTLVPAKSEHIPRVHQLFSKTNQFNVTTIRYGIPDIEQFISAAEWDLWLASVKDKFGDLGIIGLYLVRRNGANAQIDSFILSCRAMGRGIEAAMMNKIKNDYFKLNVSEIIANYAPTAKNKPVVDFFDKQGFSLTRTAGDGVKEYVLKAQDAQFNEHPGITIKVQED